MIVAQDRVRRHTDDAINRRLDDAAAERIARFQNASPEALTRRIEELDREWDIERVLETNASTLALAGLLAGASINRKWLILPGIVLPFLLLHAVQGWCPPLPILRRLGVRTRKEIDSEKYALKALRGDFEGVSPSSGSAAVQAASK